MSPDAQLSRGKVICFLQDLCTACPRLGITANSANTGQTVATLYCLGNDHNKIKIFVCSVQMQYSKNRFY